ncbi:hypothetical protein BN10_640001 [Phycicoccus elongatus Lp2]|uniref:Cobalamin biosynthesis protein CobD n=1 Tax=Phycicoccus elongatus Lp2 TaxID=1193181 RepID=N0E497_9MICO|nr:hypothetical protein BN10_640001 [Phycicoccus elongatus Lp2]
MRLGGINRYGERVEERAVLGDGRPVQAGDVVRAIHLARRVGLGAAAVTATAAAVLTRRRG